MRASLITLATLALLLIGPAYAQLAPTGPGPAWAALTPVPSVGPGVEGMSVDSVGNRIIAALGFDLLVGDTDTTRLYDILSDTWSFGTNAPGTSSEGAGIVHGSIFYTVGGRDLFTQPRAEIWAYDPALDVWNATLSPMPTPRAGLAVEVIGASIYAIGGRSITDGPCTGSPLDTVERYDIVADTWTTVAPLPSPRSDLAAEAVGGKIYVFGGCTNMLNFLSNVDVYDPETNTWSTAPADMPTARAGMYAIASKGDTVYVIGGWDGFTPGLTTNESYTIPLDSWTTGLLAMPTGRAEAGAADQMGRIYIVGGAQPAFGASVNANEVFKP